MNDDTPDDIGQRALETFRASHEPSPERLQGTLARLEQHLASGETGPEPSSGAPASAPIAWAPAITAAVAATVAVAAILWIGKDPPPSDPPAPAAIETSEREPSSEPAPDSPVELSSTEIPALPTPDPEPAGSADPVESTKQPRPESPPAVPRRSKPLVEAPPPASEHDRDDLQAELALFKRARRTLEQGNPDEALTLLHLHARRHPDGVMAAERDLLKAEALCAIGRKAEARAQVDAFLRARPTSPLRDRVGAVCRP